MKNKSTIHFNELLESYENAGAFSRFFYPTRLGKAIQTYNENRLSWGDADKALWELFDALRRLGHLTELMFPSIRQFKASWSFISYCKLLQLEAIDVQDANNLLINQHNPIFHELLSRVIELGYLVNNDDSKNIYRAIVYSNYHRLLKAVLQIMAAEVSESGFSDLYIPSNRSFLMRFFRHKCPDQLVKILLHLERNKIFSPDFEGDRRKQQFIKEADILASDEVMCTGIWSLTNEDLLMHFKSVLVLMEGCRTASSLDLRRNEFLRAYGEKFPDALANNSELKEALALSVSIWLLRSKWGTSPAASNYVLEALEIKICYFRGNYPLSKQKLFCQQKELAIKNLQYIRCKNPLILVLDSRKKSWILDHLLMLKPKLNTDIQTQIPKLESSRNVSDRIHAREYIAALLSEIPEAPLPVWIEALSFAGDFRDESFLPCVRDAIDHTHISRLSPDINMLSQYLVCKTRLFFKPNFDYADILIYFKHLLLDDILDWLTGLCNNVRQNQPINGAVEARRFCELVEQLQDSNQAVLLYQQFANCLNYQTVAELFHGLVAAEVLKKHFDRFKESLASAPHFVSADPFWDRTRIEQQFQPLMSEAAKLREQMDLETKDRPPELTKRDSVSLPHRFLMGGNPDPERDFKAAIAKELRDSALRYL